jgi:hypothetical protein
MAVFFRNYNLIFPLVPIFTRAGICGGSVLKGPTDPGRRAALKGTVPAATRAAKDSGEVESSLDKVLAPQPLTGSASAAGQVPKPVAAVTVLVDGIEAPFPFIGVPSWPAGVTQIDSSVPADAGTGKRSIIGCCGQCGIGADCH